jgi:hypothetical protein
MLCKMALPRPLHHHPCPSPASHVPLQAPRKIYSCSCGADFVRSAMRRCLAAIPRWPQTLPPFASAVSAGKQQLVIVKGPMVPLLVLLFGKHICFNKLCTAQHRALCEPFGFPDCAIDPTLIRCCWTASCASHIRWALRFPHADTSPLSLARLASCACSCTVCVTCHAIDFFCALFVFVHRTSLLLLLFCQLPSHPSSGAAWPQGPCGPWIALPWPAKVSDTMRTPVVVESLKCMLALLHNSHSGFTELKHAPCLAHHASALALAMSALLASLPPRAAARRAARELSTS